MNYQEWNDALARWFLNGPPSSYVYFRVDDAELRRMNDEFGLGLTDPAADLITAARSMSLTTLRAAGFRWKKADRSEAPPFLVLLAVSVLLVERQTDAGRTSFYEPFTELLGLPSRLSQDEYDDSFYVWWAHLASWLVDDKDGQLGLPTWKRVPPSGPRSHIGHPYTQILLRREDRQDLDDFLKAVDDLEVGDVEVADQGVAAMALLDQFRRWAASNRSVSGRLRAVLEGANDSARQSLAYVILDRLLDTVEPNSVRPQDRRLRAVPSIDDWTDRRLRLSVIAPADVTPASPLKVTVDGHVVELLEPGQPARLPIDLHADALRDGLSLETEEGLVLWFRPRDVFVLAAREWDEWCGVDEVEPAEDVYVLVADSGVEAVEQAIDRPEPNSRIPVPEGWRLYGPTKVNGTLAQVRLRASWNAVPRLAAGLALAPRQYLAGGEPRLIFPEGGAAEVLIDGAQVAVAEGSLELDLSSAGLEPGEHSVQIGPYRIPFQTIAVLQPAPIPELVGRRVSREGVFSEPDDGQFFSGACVVPTRSNVPPTLCSPERCIVLLGRPGEVERVAPEVASWAGAASLSAHVIEPLDRSLYRGGVRLMASPWWVAVEREGEWWVTALPTAGPNQPIDAAGVEASWREIVAEIGPRPHLANGARPFVEVEDPDLATRWLRYTGLEDS